MSMLQYAITSRNRFAGSETEVQAALVAQTAAWIDCGVDVIQLRERDLSAAAQAEVARKIIQQIEVSARVTKLLINGRADIAVAAGADGVHLTSSPDELTPAEVRSVFAAVKHPAPIITVSCHSLADVIRARTHRVDGILFGPIFEKPLPGGQSPLPGYGLERLREACLAAAEVPVYALGGITRENSSSCLEAGAAGIAGIRLFHG